MNVSRPAPDPPASARVRALAWSLALIAASSAAQPCAAAAPPPDPKTCLVLSGGGARGFAHIGVLRWLEMQRVPIDCVVGTSMGAVIGGLYASGLSVDRIEAAMRTTDWSALRGSDAPRAAQTPRRQEEDHEYTLPLELRMRAGRAALPASVFGGARFEQQLRAWLGPRATDESFDALPIPFRAVATRLGTGEARVLARGDLALAIRASMSVPGLFEPTRIDGGLYVDGGLVSNLPVDAARALGATRVIAVNVGTGLADEATLTSLVDVSVQTLAILTEQNVIAQIARMRPEDVLIVPPLEALSFLDFPRAGDGIVAGTRGADAQRERLLALSVSPDAWAAGRGAQAPDGPAADGSNDRSPGVAQRSPRLRADPSAGRDPADALRFGLSIGTDVTFGRLQWRRALGEPGPLGNRLWVGATLETGRITGKLLNVGNDGSATPVAGSLFLASETPIGPLHLGLGLPRDGSPRLYLFLGRP